MTSLVWMRRDLRLHDHAALATALQAQSPVQLVFVFDTDILAQFPNPDDRRLGFIAATLCRMDAELRTRGGQLLVLHGSATAVIPTLCAAANINGVYSGEDMEPATRARDAAVKAALAGSARFIQLLDHMLFHPDETTKADGTAYKVFTPYYKQWRSKVGPTQIAEYKVEDKGRYAEYGAIAAKAEAAGLRVLSLEKGAGELLAQIGYRYTPDTHWTVDDAQDRLQEFVAARLTGYETGRDALDRTGTSELSPYLRFGLVSVRECVRAALGHPGAEKWISELAWREFYASILYHFPEVVTQEFMPQYRGTIPWSYNEEHIAAFQSGKTGYPVVDAAVRELLTTGYMHNRARMIVASFVTKDLLLDWRIGDAFFAQYLMDYDLASNNGGWQWGASTGTDASPYFRIFNPVLQSKKFDPKGRYIRTHVPELRDLSDKDIHAPWLSPLMKPVSYPMPIVNHAEAKDRAIQVFREVKTPHYLP